MLARQAFMPLTAASSFRQTFRTLARAPGFTASAITAIALGVGAATLVFAVLYSVVLRPLPYREPGRLVFIWIEDAKRSIREEGFSYPTYLDWKAQAKTFEALSVRCRNFAVRITGAQPERLQADLVSAPFFEVLGLAPLHGRVFTSEEENRGDLVAVVSERLARRRFGSPAAAAGQSLEINQKIFRVIGVMPPRYGILPFDQDLWLPARKFPELEKAMEWRQLDFLMGIARLRPGVSPAEAQAELNTIGAQLAKAYPTTDPDFAGYNSRVVSFHEQILGTSLPKTLWIALGAASLVLLVSCANVASLLFARGATRRHELAIRRALGASVLTLVRQQFAEALLLSSVGGAFGVLLAWLGVAAVPHLAPAQLPRFQDLALHPASILFAVAASGIAALLFAGVPAWMLSRRDANADLQAASVRTTSRETARMQPMLVAAEFALAFVLLTAAGLFLRTFLSVRSVDPGYQTRRMLLFQANAPTGKALPYYQTLTARLGQLPNVETAGAISDFFIERNPDYTVTVEGRDTVTGEQVTVDAVSPTFLETTRVRLLRGRLLTMADYQQERPTVVVINETFARRFFPNEDPVGKHLKFATAASRDPWITVVGVIADMRRQGRERSAVCEGFGPIVGQSMDVLVRTSGRAEDLVAPVRALTQELNPSLPIYGMTTVEERLSGYDAGRRLQVWMLGALSALVLFLAAVGVFGVMQYLVNLRRRELAIRLAVGASPALLWRSVLASGIRQATAGIAAGCLLVFALQRSVSSMLYGVSPLDGANLAAAAGVLLAAGILACVFPASSAAATNPAALMRD